MQNMRRSGITPTRELREHDIKDYRLFYSNWLNYYVYQTTPYNVKDIQ